MQERLSLDHPNHSGFLSLEVYTVLRESNFHSQSEVISSMTSTPRWKVLHPMWSLFEIAHCVSRFFPKDKSQDMCAQTSAFYWEHVVSCDSSIISPPSKLHCILHSLLSGSKPASSSSKGMEEHPQERVGDNEAASLTIGCAISSQEDQHRVVLTGEWQQESLWCSSCCVLYAICYDLSHSLMFNIITPFYWFYIPTSNQADSSQLINCYIVS